MSSPATSEPPSTHQTRWFAQEVQPHDAQLKAYLRGTFPLVRDVDDVVQESYLRVWKAHGVQPIRSAKAFLFEIARHLAVDVFRRQGRSPMFAIPDLTSLSVIEDRPGVVDAVSTKEEVLLLARAFDELPERCREVMILRQIEGVPQKEIARRLGLSELTVQTHVVQGMRRMRAFFRKQAAIRNRS